jgi:hypothetical protein
MKEQQRTNLDYCDLFIENALTTSNGSGWDADTDFSAVFSISPLLASFCLAAHAPTGPDF